MTEADVMSCMAKQTAFCLTTHESKHEYAIECYKAVRLDSILRTNESESFKILT